MKKNNDNSAIFRNNRSVILAFGIFLLFYIWISLYYKIQTERQVEVDSASKETANLARAFEEHTLRTVKSAEQAIYFLEHQYNQVGRSIDIPRYMLEGRITEQPYVQLGIIDEQGELVATSEVPFFSVSLKDREHFWVHQQVDTGKLFISKPIVGRISGKWAIQMTRRINKADGSFGGVAVVSVDPFYFSAFYKQVELGDNSVITLTGRDNVVRARQSGLNTQVGQDLSRSVLAEMVALKDAGTYFAKSSIDGSRRLYSFRTLPDYPLVVTIGIDEKQVFQYVNQRIAGYYLAAGLLSLLIVCFSCALLIFDAKQKRAENSLQQAHDNLEEKIGQRAQELFAANSELQKYNRELKKEVAGRTCAEEAVFHKEEALKKNREALALAAGLAQLGPWEYNPATNLFEFGDEFYAIFATNWEREGRTMSLTAYCREFVHPEDVWILTAAAQTTIASQELNSSNQFEHRVIRRDGEVCTVVVQQNVFRNDGGEIIKQYGAIQDITSRVRTETALMQKTEMIRHMAYYDSLTDLPNRRHLDEWLDAELKKARHSGSSGAVLFIDLDDLKLVNDTYGHKCGDDIIIASAARIVAELGKDAFVGRLGGDEFIAILPGKNDRQQLGGIAKRTLETLGRKHEIYGTQFHMTSSIGIAFYPADGDTAEEIIKDADLAMYSAKNDGKKGWRFYTATMQVEAHKKVQLTNSLRCAMERGELSLHYQPQVRVPSGELVGFEALLRWNSAKHGAVPPMRFIPLAEESDLIQLIGSWVLQEACRFARQLSDQGWGEISVAVNISPKQLIAENFTTIICQAIEEAGIEPQQLELEITESILVVSMDEAIGKLNELKELGVKLSLDDFGSGYSSLTYLRQLPVNTVKIDKTFIDMITTDEHAAQIIGSIVNLAHILNLTVTAEGVETEQQFMRLALCGCDCVQGYLFSRPIPEAEAIRFLKQEAEAKSPKRRALRFGDRARLPDSSGVTGKWNCVNSLDRKKWS